MLSTIGHKSCQLSVFPLLLVSLVLSGRASETEARVPERRRETERRTEKMADRFSRFNEERDFQVKPHANRGCMQGKNMSSIFSAALHPFNLVTESFGHAKS